MNTYWTEAASVYLIIQMYMYLYIYVYVYVYICVCVWYGMVWYACMAWYVCMYVIHIHIHLDNQVKWSCFSPVSVHLVLDNYNEASEEQLATINQFCTFSIPRSGLLSSLLCWETPGFCSVNSLLSLLRADHWCSDTSGAKLSNHTAEKNTRLLPTSTSESCRQV